MSIRTELAELGVQIPLAAEIDKQITASDGKAQRLLELGFIAADVLAEGIDTGELDVKVLTEAGTATEVAKYLGKKLNLPPVNGTLPSVSGGHQVGQIQTSSDGVWSSAPAATYVRQWLANGVAISGATGATYTPVVGDIGKTLSLRVTATNINGTTSATSLPSPAVIAA